MIDRLAHNDLLQGGDLTVVEGLDGWLFLKEFNGEDVMGLYTDDNALPESLYERWAAVLKRRRERFAREGITYLTLIVPDACVAYADKLPQEIRLADQSPFARLASRLDEKTRKQVVYPLQALIDGRQTEETFQAVDSHWTDWGSWLGYLETLQTLQEIVPEVRVLSLDDIEWNSRPVFGSLGAVMTPEASVTLPVAKVKKPAARVIRRVTTEIRRGYIVVEQDAPELPVAVIVRDSFMTAPAKFFSESFRRTIFVSSPNVIFYDLLEQEKPDVVIHELAERGLVIVPDEPSRADFRWMFGDLLLEDPLAVADQRKSRSLLQAGRLEEALSASDDVLARIAPNARLILHRARLHISLGRLDAAIEALRHATSLDLTDGSPWFFLAQALLQKQRLGDASAAFDRATAVEPLQEAFWPPAIAAALQTGELERAADLSERASAIHPDSPELAHTASCVLVALDRLDEAAAAARRAVAGDKTSAVYARQLASVLVRRRDWKGARKALRVLAHIAPGDPAAAKFLDYIKHETAAEETTDSPAEGKT